MRKKVELTFILTTLTLGCLDARASWPFSYTFPSLDSMVASALGVRQQIEELGLAAAYPLAYLPTDKLIEHWGFKAETHYVTTEDGYILGVHRIANPYTMYPPVYFQHGLLASSDLWLMRGPEEELAFQLALKGYDIWLSNVRGSTYSRNHTTLSPDEEKFWDFSWHEMGTRDLPAVIDFILAKTRQKKLFYVGHSMGTTQFYVMASARPEYNDKIAVQFSLAPICFMGNMRAFDLFHPFAVDFDLYKYVIKVNVYLRTHMQKFKEFGLASSTTLTISDCLAKFLDHTALNPLTARNNFELLPRNPQVSEILFGMLQNPLTNATFWLSIFSAVGPDLELINMDTVALFLGHGPNGVSERTLQAYAQLLLWGDKFNRFDYGPEENLLRYGLRYPPAYNLSAITAKVAIYFADNDYLSHPKDVQKLAEKLPGLIRYKLIKHKKFNHMDYIWGTDSQKHFAGNIIDTIRKYS